MKKEGALNVARNLTLKKGFIGMLVLIASLSLTIGYVIVNNIRGSKAMVGEMSANNNRALYAKELQILLLKIEGGFKRLPDLEEGIEDADAYMQVARHTIEFLENDGEGKASGQGQPEMALTGTNTDVMNHGGGHEMNHGGDGQAKPAAKDIHSGHLTNVASYAGSYEQFYENARALAVEYSRSAEGDPENYFNQIDEYAQAISRDTDALMSHYVVMASQHAGHVDTMLRLTEKSSVGLLSAQAGIILLVTMLIMRVCNLALFNIRKVINDIVDQDWNLTLRLEEKGKDEFSQIAGMFNKFIERLRTILVQVQKSSTGIALAAEDVNLGNDRLAERNAEQAAALEETAASMEEMTSIVSSNAQNAAEVAKLAENMRETAEHGDRIIGQAVTAMGDINESSKKMAEIISVVDGISFQTNLLALNAAVEAARAGDQGRGFAVVAGEVRELAQRSAQAAKEVKNLIEESSARVDTGADLVNQSGESLAKIISSVGRVHEIATRVAAASEEQSEGIEQVNHSVGEMDSTTQHNTHLVEEIANASRQMKQQADELKEMVSSFTLEDRADFPVTHLGHLRTSRPASNEELEVEKISNSARTMPPKIVTDGEWESF